MYFKFCNWWWLNVSFRVSVLYKDKVNFVYEIYGSFLCLWAFMSNFLKWFKRQISLNFLQTSRLIKVSECMSFMSWIRKLIQECFPRISRPHVKFFISELYFFLLTAAVPKFKSALDSGLWFADFWPNQNWDFNSNKWMLWKFFNDCKSVL